jgi:transposase
VNLVWDAATGTKTDPQDAQWIAELLEGGKLRGSWAPPRAMRELRDLTRQRVHVLEDLNRAKKRIEQLCQSGNIKVSSVATDLFGVSGRKMLQAIVEGKHDAGWMADYAKGSLRGKRRELALALEGSFTGEQRWVLERELRQVEWREQQIAAVERRTAWTIVAEIGVEMSVFADGPHPASWAGLCPGNRESGGFAYQADVFVGFLPADVRAQRGAEGGRSVSDQVVSFRFEDEQTENGRTRRPTVYTSVCAPFAYVP